MVHPHAPWHLFMFQTCHLFSCFRWVLEAQAIIVFQELSLESLVPGFRSLLNSISVFCPLLWYYSCAGMQLHQTFQSSKAQNVEGFPLESLSRLTNEENEDTQFPMKKSALPRMARSICGNQGLRWKIWTWYGLQKKGKNSWITEGERSATQWKGKLKKRKVSQTFIFLR